MDANADSDQARSAPKIEPHELEIVVVIIEDASSFPMPGLVEVATLGVRDFERLIRTAEIGNGTQGIVAMVR